MSDRLKRYGLLVLLAVLVVLIGKFGVDYYARVRAREARQVLSEMYGVSGEEVRAETKSAMKVGLASIDKRLENLNEAMAKSLDEEGRVGIRPDLTKRQRELQKQIDEGSKERAEMVRRMERFE